MVIHNAILTGSISMQAPPVISGSLTLTGSLNATGDITASSARFSNIVTAQTLVVQIVSSSIDFVTGSTKFGSLTTNTHQFTGSMFVTGALSGTSATFSNAITANGVYSNTSDVALIVNATIPAINLRTAASVGRFTLASNYSNTNRTSFIVASGASNPSIEALLIEHSNGAATFASSVSAAGLKTSGGGTFTQGELEFTSTTSGGQLGIFTNQPTTTTLFFDHRATSNTGNFAFRNGSGGGNTLMYIAGNGNVGIGTNNPTVIGGGYRTLEVVGTGAYVIVSGSSGVKGEIAADGAIYVSSKSAHPLIFRTTDIERMRITSGGDIGIGTTSPVSLLSISKTLSADTTYLTLDNKTNTKYNWGINWAVNDSSTIPVAAIRAIYPVDNDISLAFYTYNGSGNVNERMRITSAGVALIGKTTTAAFGTAGWQFDPAGSGLAVFAINNNEAFIFNNINTGTTYEIDFRTNAVERGKISVTDSGVSYVTTSDYRVKEDLQEVNGLEKVSAIKVYDFKFKDMDLRTDGVIAHELQEVLPYAVTGEKDGAKYQGVDYAKLTPVLVKAIQELKAEFDEYKLTHP